MLFSIPLQSVLCKGMLTIKTVLIILKLNSTSFSYRKELFMPVLIVRDDITKMNCDAIVNAANSTLLGGGGVDGAIHRAAGRKLLEECKTLGGCKVGQAKITKGYNLPSKYVIHTVGPVWCGGEKGERTLLKSCYKNSLALAEKYDVKSIAFPIISSGAFGYPKELAIKDTMDAVSNYLLSNNSDMLVYIVVFDKAAFTLGQKLFSDILAYIDDVYVEEHTQKNSRVLENFGCVPTYRDAQAKSEDMLAMSMMVHSSLEEDLAQLDESFSQMLLRKIDEKGLTDAQCYKKANIDRKLFSKIRGDVFYKPRKSTALAFAVALELSLEETEELLKKAGFALSHSSKFDIIVEYFIVNKIYSIDKINMSLFDFDQPLLGS